MIITVAQLSKFAAHVTSSMRTIVLCWGNGTEGAAERGLASSSTATPFTL